MRNCPSNRLPPTRSKQPHSQGGVSSLEANRRLGSMSPVSVERHPQLEGSSSHQWGLEPFMAVEISQRLHPPLLFPVRWARVGRICAPSSISWKDPHPRWGGFPLLGGLGRSILQRFVMWQQRSRPGKKRICSLGRRRRRRLKRRLDVLAFGRPSRLMVWNHSLPPFLKAWVRPSLAGRRAPRSGGGGP